MKEKLKSLMIYFLIAKWKWINSDSWLGMEYLQVSSKCYELNSESMFKSRVLEVIVRLPADRLRDKG